MSRFYFSKPSIVVSGLLLVLAALSFPPKVCAQTLDAAMKLNPVIEKLRPLHTPMPKPGPHDWLTFHPEPGQTFQEYVQGNPALPSGKRSVIYIQPLGDFKTIQEEIVAKTATFMGLFFNLEVKIQPRIPLSVLPDRAKRVHPQWGIEQILSIHILDNVLKPTLPEDAAARIAFTPVDLWPGQGWNFIFGMASLQERVGVWSIYRNGDPTRSRDDYRLCLLRTMKTAVHEIGHMISIHHCIRHACCMNGSNHRQEADSRPLWFCPECAAKVCWATRTSPVARYEKLARFCGENGFDEEKKFYEASIQVLSMQTKVSTE
jgi:archaemetzincin